MPFSYIKYAVCHSGLSVCIFILHLLFAFLHAFQRATRCFLRQGPRGLKTMHTCRRACLRNTPAWYDCAWNCSAILAASRAATSRCWWKNRSGGDAGSGTMSIYDYLPGLPVDTGRATCSVRTVWPSATYLVMGNAVVVSMRPLIYKPVYSAIPVRFYG